LSPSFRQVDVDLNVRFQVQNDIVGKKTVLARREKLANLTEPGQFRDALQTLFLIARGRFDEAEWF